MELILTKNIQKGLEIYHDTPNAVLIDVRVEDEYAEGHIPGSINMPMDSLENDIYDVVPEMDTPVFLYCHSGNHSIQAATLLRDLGYDNAASIGGISGYQGELIVTINRNSQEAAMAKSIFERTEQRQLDTDSGLVIYWVSKCQSELTLVFLHGLTANHTLFEKQLPHFWERFHLLCWDTPAHGMSCLYTDFSYSRTAGHRKILNKMDIIS